MSTLFGVPDISKISGIESIKTNAFQFSGVKALGGEPLKLSRTEEGHFSTGGGNPPIGQETVKTFENAMLEALDGVNAMQVDSSNAIETMMVNPDAVDAHDVTIAMAKANMSLSITRTVLTRVVQAWKDVLNTR